MRRGDRCRQEQDGRAVPVRRVAVCGSAVVKSVMGLPYRHLQGSEATITCQCARHRNAAARIAPFKLKCAKHSFTKGSLHHFDYDEDVFTCIQTRYQIDARVFSNYLFTPKIFIFYTGVWFFASDCR